MLMPLVTHCGAHHFENAAKSVVAAEAALVERRARNRRPTISRSVRRWLRQARERGVVLAIVAAHFVNHEIKRWYDKDAKAARAGFVKCVAGRAGHVAVGVVFELQREW